MLAGRSTRAVSIEAVLTPNSVRFSTMMLFTAIPAATSSAHDSATSATTSARLNLARRKLDDPRPSSFRTSPMLTPDAWNAGSTPARRLARVVMPSVKITTVRSTFTLIQNGI
jgi:hypothetical protein